MSNITYENNFNNIKNSIVVNFMTDREGFGILSKLNGKISKNIFGHCSNLLKQIATVLTLMLTKTMKKCVDHICFPVNLKKAKLTLFFKSGSCTEPSNYRSCQ